MKTFTSDFRPMKNVLAGRNERSLYKLVLDGETDRVVGVHMIGPDAPEILQAAAIAVKARLKKADFDATVALHPTMSEELVLMRSGSAGCGLRPRGCHRCGPARARSRCCRRP